MSIEEHDFRRVTFPAAIGVWDEAAKSGDIVDLPVLGSQNRRARGTIIEIRDVGFGNVEVVAILEHANPAAEPI